MRGEEVLFLSWKFWLIAISDCFSQLIFTICFGSNFSYTLQCLLSPRFYFYSWKGMTHTKTPLITQLFPIPYCSFLDSPFSMRDSTLCVGPAAKRKVQQEHVIASCLLQLPLLIQQCAPSVAAGKGKWFQGTVHTSPGRSCQMQNLSLCKRDIVILPLGYSAVSKVSWSVLQIWQVYHKHLYFVFLV